MDLYILLDTSGSMEGAKIAALNDCMQNIVMSLREYADSGYTVNIDVLSFARSSRWMHESIMPVKDFDWKELHAGGMTSLGHACTMLSERLTLQQNSEDKYIILISDGCPTDDYVNDIIPLKNNENFASAQKYTIAIGDNADTQSLSLFTSDRDKVYELSKVSELLDSLTRIISSANSVSTHKVQAVSDDDDWD